MDERPSPTVFGALRTFRWSSLFIVLLVTGLSIGFGYLTRPEISTSARLVLATPTSDDAVGVNAATEPTFVRYVAQRALVATSNQVLREAASKLGNVTPSDLRDHVTAKAATDGSAITVTASAPTAKEAANMANAVVDAYEHQSQAEVQRSLSASLGAIQAAQDKIVADVGKAEALKNPTYQALADQEGTLTVATAKFGNGVSFEDRATTSDAVKPGPPYVDAAVGLALGFLLACAIAWIRADGT